jgi:hypothetical protein
MKKMSYDPAAPRFGIGRMCMVGRARGTAAKEE